LVEETEQNCKPRTATPGSRRKVWIIVGAAIALSVVAIVGVNSGWLTALTGNGTEPQLPANNPPQIASITSSTERIVPGATVLLSCSATDPDADTLSYSWSASDGAVVGEGPEVTWIAPDFEGLFRVFVTVTDVSGGTAEQSVSLGVRTNAAPEILVMQSEVSEEIGWVVPGARVFIDCEVEDPDGDEVSYSWAATHGDIYGEGAAIIWIASKNIGLEWITVRVEDSYGAVSERSIPITINTSQPPEIRGFNLQALDTDMFKPYGDSWRIFRERSCAIQAIVADPEGDYTYHWTAELGTIAANGPDAVWKSPNAKGWVNIVVLVSDKHGSESSASIRLYVETCPSCI
jgi:hypothetical protein